MDAQRGFGPCSLSHLEKSPSEIGDLLLDGEVFNEIRRDAVTQVDAFQQNNPLVAGISKEALRERLATPGDVFSAVLDTLAG